MGGGATTMCRGRARSRKGNPYCGNGLTLSSSAEARDMFRLSANSIVQQTVG